MIDISPLSKDRHKQLHKNMPWFVHVEEADILTASEITQLFHVLYRALKIKTKSTTDESVKIHPRSRVYCTAMVDISSHWLVP